MVRSVADRAFLPAKSLFEQVGNMMILTGKTITATVRPPYPYGGEFISQFIFALQLCWFPMLISTVAFGFGAPGLQAANFLTLFGALDRLGGFFILASVREFAPFVTAVVVAGVAGTAITADLGARKIREELDALQVLGVDPIKNLVVPRFLSLMILTGLLDIYALLFGIARFCGRTMGLVYSGRVLQFFGEALRQAGILILGSTIVIWGLVFILGLQCGIEGAYFNRSVGAPAYAGVFAAWCDLREVIPYAFGYMMAAKVGTGIVAELGAMRISDEIDALEVMGVPPMTFLAATRLLGAWMTLPFMYMAAIGIGYFASWLAVVKQIGDVSSAGYFLIFWMFQNPPDLLFSVIKAMVMATAIVLVGCYYGYTASGGPVGVGTATAESSGT